MYQSKITRPKSLGTDWTHCCVTVLKQAFDCCSFWAPFPFCPFQMQEFTEVLVCWHFHRPASLTFHSGSGIHSANSGQLCISPHASLVQFVQLMWVPGLPMALPHEHRLVWWSLDWSNPVTRPDLFSFLGDCGSVSHQWQGSFNAYLIHFPFGIIHNDFKLYNYLLFKLHYFFFGSRQQHSLSILLIFFLPQQAFLSSRCDEKACFHYYFLFLKNPGRPR